MTKPLLTTDDIKAFILDAVNNVTFNQHDYVDREQLMKKFNLTEHWFKKYRKMGMPGTYFGRKLRFSTHAVEKWLNKNASILN